MTNQTVKTHKINDSFSAGIKNPQTNAACLLLEDNYSADNLTIDFAEMVPLAAVLRRPPLGKEAQEITPTLYICLISEGRGEYWQVRCPQTGELINLDREEMPPLVEYLENLSGMMIDLGLA